MGGSKRDRSSPKQSKKEGNKGTLMQKGGEKFSTAYPKKKPPRRGKAPQPRPPILALKGKGNSQKSDSNWKKKGDRGKEPSLKRPTQVDVDNRGFGLFLRKKSLHIEEFLICQGR